MEQAARNSEVLHSVRSEVGLVTARVDHVGADMAAVKAALAMHGRTLDVLQQDVRQTRGEVSEIRSEVSEINRKLDILVAAATPGS